MHIIHLEALMKNIAVSKVKMLVVKKCFISDIF